MSDTFNFNLPTSGVIFEAFDRCGIRPPEIVRHHMISARTSINLISIGWANRGLNFWKMTGGTIPLVVTTPATVTYQLPANLVTMTELWYRQVDGYGPDQPADRIMIPITRTDYAMLPNKLTPGLPTQYWLQMLDRLQITIWAPPLLGTPNYELAWYGLERMADANLVGTNYPDTANRALQALVAELSLALWQKYGNMSSATIWQTKRAALKEEAAQAWNDLQTRDQEPGPTLIQPAIGIYGNMR